MKQHGFNTRSIHDAVPKQDVHQAIRYPLYAGVAYDFASAEDIEAAFASKIQAHVYSRSTNPTVEAFERKLNSLEGGFASIAVASGMAAITNTLMNLLQQGDHMVSAASLFGGSCSLFQNVLEPFGVETSFVDIDRLDEIEEAIAERTKVIFFETISNPKMNVPDVAGIVELAHAKNIVVIADATMTPPCLFQAKRYGVDVVIHSTTKAISGGATSVGGAIVDLGNFDWKKLEALRDYHKFGEWAFIARLRKDVYREMGACLSPFSAYLQSLGLETLTLRVRQSCENTMKIARFLERPEPVLCVNYPGLPSSPYHEIATKQFHGGYGGVLTFELSDKASCFAFLNRLELIKRATNLGDNSSLILHPASTIYAKFSPEQREAMGVPDGLIRLSVGIEDVEDLIEDLQQALEG
ncbi:MAG: O-acetylhomoserine aminocarboxypropyltransferase/cysteine synthase [bacterium]|nr:O-acetylhomoserine aminocarboxypropyltransferase/cysteine synthase [bacterium]